MIFGNFLRSFIRIAEHRYNPNGDIVVKSNSFTRLCFVSVCVSVCLPTVYINVCRSVRGVGGVTHDLLHFYFDL